MNRTKKEIKQFQDKAKDLVKFVMDKANGIDDYNWGQESFEKDLTARINTLVIAIYEQARDSTIEEINKLIDKSDN
jgi:chlorite dismutase